MSLDQATRGPGAADQHTEAGTAGHGTARATPGSRRAPRVDRFFPPLAAAESLAARLGWSLVCVTVGMMALQSWGGSLVIPGANGFSVGLLLAALGGIWRIWVLRGGLRPAEQVVVLLCLATAVGLYAAQEWIANPSYGTDAVAFDQYAAWLAAHGANPYTHSMAPALDLFHVPAIYHTYRLDGTAVESLSYPAGSFLFYVPLLALGASTQVANIVDLGGWFLTALLMWRMLPAQTRWAAGLMFAGVTYLGFTLGGVTDTLYLPFVLVAVYRWDRYGDPAERGPSRWIGPLALGLAGTVKQTPWFLAPYLLVGVWIETRRAGRNPWLAVARYLGTTGVVFALVNAPFVVASPRAWLRGTVLPLVDPTIPDGQGLVDASIFHQLGGGHLALYSLAGAVFTLVSVVAFAVRYPALKRAWIPLVAISFALPTRSFASYLLMLLPAALVAATSVTAVTEAPLPRLARRSWALALGGLGVVGALLAAAVTVPGPFKVTITGIRSTGQLQTVDEISVHVTNRTGAPQRPHFTVNANNHATTFWYPYAAEGGAYQPVIGPHRSATLVLHAPNTASQPSISAPFLVEAFTSKPATLSTSARYEVSREHTRITPDAVNRPVKVGDPVTLTVQVENRYGSPVHRAGVRVTLGQIVYGQVGLVAGEASINGHPEGFSPVGAVTDANGQATFTVRGAQAQEAPIYYEAWLTGDIAGVSEAPHGYSNQVSIQYTP